MNRFYLRVIGLFDPLWKSLGADTGQLQLILSTKLMMDDRRPNTLQAMKRKKKFVKSATLGTMLISALFGLFMLALLVLFSADLLNGLTIYFSFFIVMLALTLISDFTSVLIDVRDNYIILPRPVNDRTFLLSRLLHIGIHLSKMAVPMALPALIYLGITRIVTGAIVFLFLVILATVLTVFLVNVVYLFMLKVITPARFKEILNYIQIGFAIFIFAFYEFSLNVVGVSFLKSIDITAHKWVYVLPPFWLASLWSVVMDHRFQWLYLLMGTLAIVVPLAAIWLVVRYLAPSFNSKLSAINASADDAKPVAGSVPARKSRLPEALASLFIKNRTERACFVFGWKLTARSRDFKLKVYPTFGYIIVMFFVFFFMGKGDLQQRMASFQKNSLLLVLVYLGSFILMTTITFLKFSDKYKAAWIFYAAPIQGPGKLMRAALKMLIVKYFLLIYAVVSVIALYFRGPSFIPNLILGFVNVLLISILWAFLYLKSLPFSNEWRVEQSSGRFMQSFLLMILVGGLGFLHFAISGYTMVVWILIPLIIIADWLLLESFGSRRWEQLAGE
jgi:hypothetical protein